jgi:predicted RNA-binding protein
LIEGQESISQLDPWSLYLYAMKSPVTKLKYQKRLSTFLQYIGLAGITEEQAGLFAQKGRQDSNWAFNCILKFIKHELERVNRKKIRPGTLRNYVKSIKLFSEMADLNIVEENNQGAPKGKTICR